MANTRRHNQGCRYGIRSLRRRERSRSANELRVMEMVLKTITQKYMNEKQKIVKNSASGEKANT